MSQNSLISEAVKLTQFSHGAGCGCKIAPAVLDKILHSSRPKFKDARLIVGNETRDDAAVFDLLNGSALISTTDFFMPIVDDAFDFGRIASANAISDVYAMGGSPVLAIAILGWPVGKIGEEVAAQVLEGSRAVCSEAGISLAGGHSIDSPEPIFGLAVNGLVDLKHLKRNDTARAGDLLFLTKPIGIGAISTAQKKGMASAEDLDAIVKIMTTLNRAGEMLGKKEFIHSMTDVTGFGLLGHLNEMCVGSKVGAELWFDAVPRIPQAEAYIAKGCVPGGTNRNWASYGSGISGAEDDKRLLLADPQTSGGLLIACDPAAENELKAMWKDLPVLTEARPIGKLDSSGSIRVI